MNDSTRNEFDNECLIYQSTNPKMVLVHRWNDTIIHNIHDFGELLKKLQLGNLAEVGNRSNWSYSRLIANAGITLIFTGYDDGWYKVYNGNCFGACCAIYPGMMTTSKNAYRALNVKKNNSSLTKSHSEK